MTHSGRSPLAFLEAELTDLERHGLRRRPADTVRGDGLSFCSNDYLGLAGRWSVDAPSGASASRLVDGDHAAHRALEAALATWLGTEACLAFPSGYAANVGILSALARPGDLLVSDALNHASLIDGARLSRARVVVTPHNDLEAIASALAGRTEPRAWVAVESYYSMDADGPDLRALRGICDAHGAALVVDEAHALGVLGPDGRGRCAEAGVAPDVLVGTLGKSFGSQGGVAAGSAVLREWLWNRARSFVFSTGLAPASAEAARLALEHIVRTPALRAKVHALSARARDGLSGAEGITTLGFGHVIPVVVGSAERATAIASLLADEGIHLPPIRPPTVPPGTARLRLTISARQEEADVDRVVAAIRRAAPLL